MNISILKSIENEMIKNNLTSFSVDRAINKKRAESVCNNALHVLALMSFSVLFWLISRSTEKILDSFLNSIHIQK